MSLITGVLSGLWGAPAWAERKADSNSLFFPFEKNNVQILPQRFEYELKDKDNFRIGNVNFDARLFQFEVKGVNQTGVRRINVRWPAGLLTTGEITILDNIGKAVWNLPVDRSSIKIQRRQVEGGGTALTAQITGAEMPADVFSRVQFSPYFRVCVQRAEGQTRIAICSKDFYFDQKGDRFVISSRDSARQESFVNVNGTRVDPVGLIFLQGVSSVISLRALLLSGAQIEVDTRLKEVNFRDMYMSEDGQKFVVTAVGAEPVGGQKINRLADGAWQTEVSIDRPVIYLKGEGDIPMRQEFITEGTIRSRKLKIESTSNIPRFTYSNELTVDLLKKPGYTLGVPDQLSRMEDLDGEKVRWTLLSLSEGVRNRRLVRVSQGDEIFMAAWEVERGRPWHVRAGLGLPASARVQFERWFDNQNLALGADLEHHFSGLTPGAKFAQRFRGLIYWSVPDHINMTDLAWGPVIAPQSLNFDTLQVRTTALGAFYRAPWPKHLSFLGDQLHTELEVFNMPMGDPQLQNAWMLKADSLFRINGGRYWYTGFETRQGRISTTGDYLKVFGLSVGLSSVF